VVLFINTVMHRNGRGARSAGRKKRACQAYEAAEQQGASKCIAITVKGVE